MSTIDKTDPALRGNKMESFRKRRPNKKPTKKNRYVELTKIIERMKSYSRATIVPESTTTRLRENTRERNHNTLAS